MKIAGAQSVQSHTIRRRDQAKESSGAKFASQLSASRPPSGAAPASQAGSIDGILALQEIDEDGRGGRQAREHGEAILDRLDEIRHGLLTGNVNSATLERLLKEVRRQHEEFQPGNAG